MNLSRACLCCASILFCAVFLFAQPAYSQSDAECNACATIPFNPDPPCVSYCRYSLLMRTPLERLQNVLSLSQSELQLVIDLRNVGSGQFELNSQGDGPEEFQILSDKFQSLTQEQLNELSN